MPRYEYKVVPAPNKGLKGKNVKGAEARFSHALQELMNGLSGYGWEYQRAETLPSIERAGLTGSKTEWRNVLVFRRPREGEADAFNPELLPAPQALTSGPDPIEAKKNKISRNPQGNQGSFEDASEGEDHDDLNAAPALLNSLAKRRKKPAADDGATSDAAKGGATPADTPPAAKD